MGQNTPQRSFPILELSESHLLQDNKKGRSSSCRYTSVVYTPARGSQDRDAIKKEGEQELSYRQLLHGEFVKDPLLWGSAELDNVVYDEEKPSAKEIPMLPFRLKRINSYNKSVSKDRDAFQLPNKVQQSNQNLQRKDLQSQAAESRAEQISLLNAKKERLEETVRQKDALIQNLNNELFTRQARMENMKVAIEALEEGLSQLLCQLADMTCILENDVATYSEDQIDVSNFSRDRSVEEDQQLQHVEEVKNKYLKAVEAARENPSEDALLLASMLREQLRSELLQI